MQPFVIIASGRCGSTFLRLWLNNHAQIRCHGEVFLNHYKAKDGFREFCLSNKLHFLQFKLHNNKILRRISFIQNNHFTNSLIKSYLESLYYNPKHSAPWKSTSNWDDYQPRDHASNEDLVGFKLVYIDFIRFGYLGKMIKRNKAKVILLHRENLLRQEVSQLTSKARKIAHSTDDVEQVKVSLDVNSLLATFNKNERELENIKAKLPLEQCMQISYETLFSNLDESRKEILSFLEVDDQEMELPKLVKLNKSPLSETISNFESVRDTLVSSNYQHFLN